MSRRIYKGWIAGTKKTVKVHYKMLLIVLIVISGILYMITRAKTVYINPVAYKPLLAVIAKGESSDNYNAYFGNPRNKDIQFTQMTIREVLQWQNAHVRNGSPSSAVGRYQIIAPTLSSLVQQRDIDISSKFDPAMQDALAIALMERRGSIDYAMDTLSRESFAANISQEWAALPKIKGEHPEQSYYAGDGLNKATISRQEILQAVDQFRKAHDSSK